MKRSTQRRRFAAFVLAAVLTLIVGSVTPAVAVDNSVPPPSLTSIRMLSPAVMYPDDETFQVRVGQIGYGGLFYEDSLGGTHRVCFDECGAGYADTAVGELTGWPQGPAVLSHIEVMSWPGDQRVVYWRDGRVEKFPSDMQDPPPVTIDWASLDFRLDPLREYSNSPKLQVEGPPSVGFTLKMELAALDPKPTRVEYGWMHLDSLQQQIGSGLTYVTRAADIGHRIVARVRAYNRGYVTYESFSTPTTPVATPVQVSPAPVVMTDRDGTANDTYTIPETVGIDYLVGGAGSQRVVSAGTYSYSTDGDFFAGARAKPDYVLAPGAVATWWMRFKNTPFLVAPAAVTFTDKDGTNEDTYTVPATAGIDYLVGGRVVAAGKYPAMGKVTATARPKTDYALAAGAPASWSTTFKATPYSVSPTPVTFTDKVGTKDDTYTVPATTGVEYLIDGEVVAAGTYPGTWVVIVSARAKKDYVLAPGAPALWVAAFKGSLSGAVPTITGTAKVGSTLTAVPGTWGPPLVGLAYQWKAGGAVILGATSSTYKPTSAHLGKTLTVAVTGSKAGFANLTKTSPATAAVAKGSLVGPTPQITGIAKVGSTLTGNPGTWSPSTISPRYQWYRSGVAIIGATALTYKPTSADVGKTLTFRVTAYKIGYTTAVKTSPATAAVVK
jgi:hypothetical protein